MNDLQTETDRDSLSLTHTHTEGEDNIEVNYSVELRQVRATVPTLLHAGGQSGDESIRGGCH